MFSIIVSLSSVSFIHEGRIFISLVLASLRAFVLARTGYMCEHLFVLLGKVWREVSLLELAFDFAPLAVFHGFGNVVGAGAGRGLFRDDPGRSRLGLGLTDVRSEVLRLHQPLVLVIILGRWVLRGDPLGMLRKVHSLITAIINKNEKRTQQ